MSIYMVCDKCKAVLPERWTGARCTPLPPVGGSMVYIVTETESGVERPGPKHLCVECTTRLKEWISRETLDHTMPRK
jgi:hypothetical protein